MSPGEDKLIEEKYKAWTYSSAEFDKAIVYIASGALGISFAFIEKLIKITEQTQHKHLLTKAWYLFAIVILVSMFSHYVSIESNRWAIHNHIDENSSRKEIESYERTATFLNWVNRLLSLTMIVLLLTGFFNLIGFIEWNL